MSVKKIKISELKQLPQDAAASDIFMPAADSNNKTYRVPLSRYDNAKGAADTAAAAANAAAQAAATATESANNAAESANNAASNANAAATRNLASGTYPGIVRGSQETAEHLEVYPNEVKDKFGNIFYANGIATTQYMHLKTNQNLKQLIVADFVKLDATIWILKGTYQYGWKGNATNDYYAIAHIVEKNMVAYDLEDGKTWVCGITTSMQWITPTTGTEYTLPVASATKLGGVKVGKGLYTDSDGVLSVLDSVVDTYIQKRFYDVYIAYNNSAPANQVAAVRSILEYEGQDEVKNALAYVLGLILTALVQKPEGLQPLSNE